MHRPLTLALALTLAPLAPARAHQPGLSRAELRIEPGRAYAVLIFARGEIADLVPGADGDRNGRLDEVELLSVETELSEQVLKGIRLAVESDPCAGAVARIAFVEEDGLSVAVDFTCPPRPGDATPPAVTVRLPLLARLAPGHRMLGQVVFADRSPGTGDSGPLDFVAHRRRASLTIRRPDPGAPAPAPEPTPDPAPTPIAPAPARWPWLLVPAALVAALGLVIRRRARR